MAYFYSSFQDEKENKNKNTLKLLNKFGVFIKKLVILRLIII